MADQDPKLKRKEGGVVRDSKDVRLTLAKYGRVYPEQIRRQYVEKGKLM